MHFPVIFKITNSKQSAGLMVLNDVANFKFCMCCQQQPDFLGRKAPNQEFSYPSQYSDYFICFANPTRPT
jgi:hypothetical protein